MKESRRRWLIVTCIFILLLFTVTLVVQPARESRYLAETRIMIRPYTNALFTKQFETAMIQSIPGMIRLKVTPLMNARPGSGVPIVTNGALIKIVVVGASGPEVERLADQAAISLCSTTRQGYAVKAEIIEKATRARPYSFFHDRITPGIDRLFEK